MGIGGIGASTKRRVEIPPYRSQPPPLLHQPPPPPPQFSTKVHRALLLAAAIGLMYIVVDQSDFQIPPPSSPPENSAKTNPSLERESEASSFHVLKSADLTPSDPNSQRSKREKDGSDLELILEKASMKDRKTVIITTVNAAWAKPSSIFDLFLESFKIGYQTRKFLENLVVVAMDQEAYQHCAKVHRYCFSLITEGVDFSGELKFRSDDYRKMMWRRIDFLRSVLEMGYSFIFSDVDVAWFRDPFERFYHDGDIQIAIDRDLLNSTSHYNEPNAGFVYVKSNSKTIQFYKYWHYQRLAFPGLPDQEVLNKVKFHSFLDKIGLELRFLDTPYFGGFCEPSDDLDVVVTMHANCCKKLKWKIHDIELLIEDWKNYKMGRGEKKWTETRLCEEHKSRAEKEKIKAEKLARAAAHATN